MAASFACRQQGNPYQCEALECQSAMKLLMVNGPNYLRQSPPRGATIANAAYYRHTTPEKCHAKAERSELHHLSLGARNWHSNPIFGKLSRGVGGIRGRQKIGAECSGGMIRTQQVKFVPTIRTVSVGRHQWNPQLDAFQVGIADFFFLEP